MYPVKPTVFQSYPYRLEWGDTDYMHTQDGNKEWPYHHCKLTYQASYPFIQNFAKAIDIGCRDGEYTRYLQYAFGHTYCFDPRVRKYFPYNVQEDRVTHFACALGDEVTEIEMFGGTHQALGYESATTVQCLRLDDFNLIDIDYIKIDVEGFERKVLIGAEVTIRRDLPLIVIEQNGVTIDGEERYAAKQWLEQLGYEHVATCPRGWDFVMAPHAR